MNFNIQSFDYCNEFYDFLSRKTLSPSVDWTFFYQLDSLGNATDSLSSVNVFYMFFDKILYELKSYREVVNCSERVTAQFMGPKNRDNLAAVDQHIRKRIEDYLKKHRLRTRKLQN